MSKSNSAVRRRFVPQWRYYPRMQQEFGEKFGRVILLVLLSFCVIVGGCRTPPKDSSAEGREKDERGPWRIAGKIESVNLDLEYVLLKCELSPPRGALGDVYRDAKKVGEVRFSSRSDHPYYTADIVSGKPRRGDLVVY